MVITLEGVFAVLSVLGWIGSTLFLIIYHRTSRWWELGYGRALFILAFVAVLFFTTSVMYNIFGSDYPGRSTLRVVNLLLSVSMVWYLLGTLVRGGAAARRKKQHGPGEEQQDVLGDQH